MSSPFFVLRCLAVISLQMFDVSRFALHSMNSVSNVWQISSGLMLLFHTSSLTLADTPDLFMI